MLIMARSVQESIFHSDTVIYLLQNLGFVLNLRKSVLEPSRKIEFLGMVLDSLKMEISLPQEKLVKLMSQFEQEVESKDITIMDLTKLIGKLGSTAQEILPAQHQVLYFVFRICYYEPLQKTLDYLQSKKITITVEYLPGHLNVTADWESWNFQDKSDWKLSLKVFAEICQKLGIPSIDLFASQMSHHLPIYMAWKPDLESQATNTIYQPWTKMFPHAFPTFNLIHGVFSKLRKERITMILVAPIWQSQAWYSVFLSICIHNSLLLPHKKDLILATLGKTHPSVVNQTLNLVAWLVSGNHCHQKTFQTKLQSLYQVPGGKVQSLLTNQPDVSGLAGVVNGKLIL